MKLKELRLKNGYTQRDIAAKLKITPSGYGFYEAERSEPNIETLTILADLYHVSIDELIGRQHNNFIDKGLLSDTEINILNIMQELNPLMLNKLESYALALYSTQQDQENIKNKLKGDQTWKIK